MGASALRTMFDVVIRWFLLCGGVEANDVEGCGLMSAVVRILTSLH